MNNPVEGCERQEAQEQHFLKMIVIDDVYSHSARRSATNGSLQI